MSEFKSGFVTLIGRTNVGKSSIINRLVGEKVSAVTNKTQTTRKNIRAILNTKGSQIIFIDTPGLHRPKSKLSNVMIESAISSIPDVDVVVYVVEAISKRIDEPTLQKIIESNKKTILVINKTDLVDGKRVADIIEQYKNLHDFVAIVPLSVKQNINIDELQKEIERNLDEGPAYYDVEEYTDQTLRELVEETIREKALKLLQDEVPHGIYVQVDKMMTKKTRYNEKFFDINSTIFCLKESHKGIIIGKGGSMLKKIGSFAREDLEKMLNTKVNLNIWVKIDKDWINNSSVVKKYKYD
ncbi:MAG: GTPase Era [Clostridia bacterium]|nr:GTPase Era [Clostridia bacterium]